MYYVIYKTRTSFRYYLQKNVLKPINAVFLLSEKVLRLLP